MIDPKTAGTWTDDDRLIPYEPPDWYVGMLNAKYLGESFCAAHGIRYGPIVERWTITAQSAENGARAALQKQVERDAKRRR